jgi:hypothetical protein
VDHQPVLHHKIILGIRVRRPLERTVVLPLKITCIVVVLVIVLVYLALKSRPRRFRLKMTLLKLVSIEIEVDALDKPGELPGSPTRPGRYRA